MTTVPTWFRPMLAADGKTVENAYEILKGKDYIVQYKTDGIRCFYLGDQVFTRQAKPLPNQVVESAVMTLADALMERLDTSDLFLDMELSVLQSPGFEYEDHLQTFRNTQSFVMSKKWRGNPVDLGITILDVAYGKDLKASLSRSYKKRLDSLWMMQDLVGGKCPEMEDLVDECFELASVTCCSPTTRDAYMDLLNLDLDGLRAVYDAVIASKGEGIILRNLSQPYKFGRSTLSEGGIIKIKGFTDYDATVQEVVEAVSESGEPLGRVGALVCSLDDTGETFKVGTGWDHLRAQLWWKRRAQLPGKRIKVSGNLTPAGSLRHPSFIGFHDETEL